MQIGTWTPPVRQKSLPGYHHTLSGMGFHPAQQMEFFNLQQTSFDQQSARLSNPHTFQPVSNPANIPSNQTRQTWGRGCQSQSSFDGHSPNVVLHYKSLQNGQATHSSEQEVLNTTFQRNYNDLHCMQNFSYTPRVAAPPVQNCVNSYGMYYSNSLWQLPLNGQHHRVQTTYQASDQLLQAELTAQINHSELTMNTNQGQTSGIEHHNATQGSAAFFPAASRIPVDSFPHSWEKTTSSHSSQMPSNSSSQIPPETYSARSKPATQKLRKLKQITLSQTRDAIQSQNTPISDVHSKTDVSAIQSSTQPQILQSNNTMGLPSTSSRNLSTCRISTSQKSTFTPGYPKYFQSIVLRMLLQKDMSQVSALTSSGAKNGSQQPAQNCTTGCNANGVNNTQFKSWQDKESQKSVKETDISVGSETRTDSSLAEPQRTNENESTICEKRNKEVQDSINLDQRSQLIMVQQANKAAVVVPPISQQCLNHGQQNDAATSPQDIVPLKLDTAKNTPEECTKMVKETNVPNVTIKLIEDLPQVTLSPNSLSRLGSESATSVGISEKPRSENAGSQHCDSSQCRNGSTTLTSSISKDAICVDSTSKRSVEQNDDQRLEFSSDDTPLDLPPFPALDYTLKDLRYLVNSLEVSPSEKDKSTVTDVMKSILDLYYSNDQQKMFKLEAFQELLKTASEVGIKKTHAVVLQHLRPKHFKVLESNSQTLNNETNLQSKNFGSSWLNVDGPADVEHVLAEPISDYNITWCKKVSQTVENVQNVVDRPAQIDTDNAEDLAMHANKDVLNTTTDNISHVEPELSGATYATCNTKTDARILEEGCLGRTSDHFSTMQSHSKRASSESSDAGVTSNSDEFEETNSSERSESTSDLFEIIILSSEDARKIFNECFECDQKIEPHRIPQEERKDPVTVCVKNHSDDSKVKPLDDLKFTCPHVSSLACGNDFFCPTCWQETPVFDIDQDEILLSLKDVEPNMDSQKPNHSQANLGMSVSRKQLDYTSATVCQESNSIINYITSTPKPGGPEVMRDPNPGDQIQSSSPTPAQEPYRSSKNRSVVKSGAEDLQETTPSVGTQTEHLKMGDSCTGTEIRTETVSLSSCKNLQSPQTDAVPDDEGLNFSPAIVLEQKCTHKHHPKDHWSMSSNDDQVRDANTSLGQVSPKTKAPSQTPNITRVPEDKNAVHLQQKRPIGKGKGHDGQSKETKKLRLQLYGSNRRTSSCQDEVKSPETPVSLNISSSSHTGKNYTDKPSSAKEKVYSQWSSTFFRLQKNSSKSSNKKSGQHVEDCLKLKIQALKIAQGERQRAEAQHC